MPIEPWRRPLGLSDLPGAATARLGCVIALSAAVGACAVTPLPPPAPAPVSSATPAPVPPSPAPLPAPSPAPAPAPSAPPPAPAAPAPAARPAAPIAPSLVSGPIDVRDNEAVLAMLRYADRVRALTPAELTLEIAALGDPGTNPPRQLQLAIALMHNNVPVDTARALGLAQRAANSPHEDAQPFKPIARLLVNRLQEQRKLEEANDRQGQQLREQQRRLDQLNERLEAMRAIERSLNNRPPAAAPAQPPAAAPRPPTP